MSLERFMEAQARVWPGPLEEIQAGSKKGHWMWFTFPQLRGLGQSAMAQRYGIADLEEARAYLAHPVLGPRLIEITRAMLSHADKTPEAVLGPVDAMKLRSCLTLFETADGDAVFGEGLRVFYEGRPCEATLTMIEET